MDEIENRYDEDVFQKRAQTLARLKKTAKKKADFDLVAKACLRLSSQALKRGNPEAARKILENAKYAADRSGGAKLSRRVDIQLLKVQNKLNRVRLKP